MKPTIPKLAMASTKAGMRRILKQRLPPDEYIRKAVIAGVYPGSSDAEEQRNNKKLKKRRNVRTGASVFEFPAEYEIMKMNTITSSEPARITEKDRKKMRMWDAEKAGSSGKKTDMEHLIKAYLKRNSLSSAQSSASSRKASTAAEEEKYYTKLLGVPPPGTYSSSSATNTRMSNKSVLLDNAYNFALKQFALMKNDESGKMTEQESVNLLEDILKKEQLDERMQSRKVTDEIRDWRDNNAKQTEEGEAEDKGETEETKKTKGKSSGSASATVGLPSILHSKPYTITALTTWSKRLALLPYNQWSVGAVTALDHWIAIDVLGMDELTWQMVLEGQAGGVALGRDIVDVRCALFPETIMLEDEDEDEDDAFDLADQDNEKKKKEVEQSIDELLASLGGFDEEDEESSSKQEKKDTSMKESPSDEDADADADNEEIIEQMKVDLQQWRSKCESDGPYDSWEEDKKKEFDAWLEKYVRLLANEEWELQYVDYKATRETLLSSPSTTQDESDEYWSSLRDETQAEIFLQSVLAAQENNGDNDSATSAFLSLPYETQLKRFIHLGTLRPLYDEYMSESSKQQFIKQNIHTLLENVYLEHLVSDPKGSITVDDIGSELLQSVEGGDGRQVKKGERFRIELLKYGTDEYGTTRAERARSLYRAWNEHKANRARYEEIMFKKGKIGLKAKKGNAK